MPTNNNGNSKADALALVKAINLPNGYSCKTFMDCVRGCSEEMRSMKINELGFKCAILTKLNIKTSNIQMSAQDYIDQD